MWGLDLQGIRINCQSGCCHLFKTCFCIFWVSEVAEVKTVADAGLSKDWIWFIFGFSMIVSFADTLSQLQNKDATHESAKK